MKKRLFALVMMTGVMLAGCSGDNEAEKSKETEITTVSEVKETEKETEASEEKEEVQDKVYEVTVEELYVKSDTKNIYGKVYRPAEDGEYPAVILSHGYNGCHADFTNECKYYAQNGYVAYAYDFSGGSTRSKSEGASTDMTIFTEKEDLLTVFSQIKELDYVDEDKIFLFGGSQGGLVTTLAAEEIKDEVCAMMLYFPALNVPDDWRNNYKTEEEIPDSVDFWGLRLGKEFFTSIRDFYTFDNIGTFDKDILIIHGDKDVIAPLSVSQRAEEIYESVELVVLKGEAHGFTPAGGKTAMEKVLQFMKEH